MGVPYRWAKIASIGMIAVLLCSCATFGQKMITPSVTLIDVTPLNMNLSSQQLRFKLKINNPNSFELPLGTINFVARFNDSDVASGRSHQATVIPPHQTRDITIDVTAGIHQIAESLKGQLRTDPMFISYQLSGAIQVANWNSAIPFDVDGILDINKKLPLPKQ